MSSPIFRNPPWEIKQTVKALAETVDWGLSANHIPDLWKDTQGEGIRIASIDTGCDLTHPDLKEAIVYSEDFTNSMFGPMDRNGHGTHTAGTMIARQNGIGLIGVCPKAELEVYKALGDDGSGRGDWVAKALFKARQRKNNIVVMSLGSPFDDPMIHHEVNECIKVGMIVCCAAGNDGNDNSVNYPGRYAIAIAAYDKEFQLTDFSSRGPEVITAAPGKDIMSTFPTFMGNYAALDGTSMANPFAAGVIVLMLAAALKNKKPLPNQDEVKNRLKATSKDAGPSGFDPGFGWGLINAGSLISDQITPPKTEIPKEVLFSWDTGDYILELTRQKK